MNTLNSIIHLSTETNGYCMNKIIDINALNLEKSYL